MTYLTLGYPGSPSTKNKALLRVRLKATSASREQTIEILSAPYAFGAGYALAGGQIHLTGYVVTGIDSYFVFWPEFESLMSRYPTIGLKISRVVIKRLQRASRLIADLSFSTARQRLLHGLARRGGIDLVRRQIVAVDETQLGKLARRI